MSSTIRVRFAPSPTGYLHVGGLRTALYNYLFARKHSGVFILRIEDTDRTRYVEGAVDNLIATLKWAGLEYDEGPDKGGDYGPYVQSERLEIYRHHADQLLHEGKAYHCFCTPERLEEMRKVQQKSGIPPKYDRRCLLLDKTQIEENLRRGVPHTIRLRVPDELKIVFDDVIRGRVEFAATLIDDQVLLKSDGYPTYHLANVVDDHLMKITHVIRGEEWLSSTPKHVILYRYFGWDLPVFAHLPLLLNPDRSKLSKRQGDVAVEDYRDKGYLRDALVNFVLLLGWGPTDDKEILTREEMIREFSLERVGKAGAIFNLEKLKWLNEQYIRTKPEQEIANMLKPLIQREGFALPSDDYLCNVIQLMKERVSVVNDFVSFSSYFFKEPDDYEESYVKKCWNSETAQHLQVLLKRLETTSEFTKEYVERIVRDVAQEFGIPASKLIHPLRLSLTGVSVGPGVFEMMSVFGWGTVKRRVERAIAILV
jgi:glutamyl-tRNA synthetase